MVRKVAKRDILYDKGDFMVIYSESSMDNFDLCQVDF